MVKIIGISGISGSGKSVLTHALGKILQATMLFWDDFDPISESPSDYVKWYESDRNYDAWKYDALSHVLKILHSGVSIKCPVTNKTLQPTDFIIFDAPLGRKHHATGQYIDYGIYLDTPLDIALARRILRDYRDKSGVNTCELLDEIQFYLTSSRPLFVMDEDDKAKCDLVIDGSIPLDAQIKIALNNLTTLHQML